jgi:MbtH protein
MANPFEDENGKYCVLVNEEGQYSLWPSFRDAPAGWSPVGASGDRQTCLDWIDSTWRDMRPKSLVAAMENEPKRHQQR